MRSADCLHALCESEAQAIRAYIKNIPVAVIPNGVRMPTLGSDDLNPPIWQDLVPKGEKVLLFLGRFHQKKGLEPLMTA